MTACAASAWRWRRASVRWRGSAAFYRQARVALIPPHGAVLNMPMSEALRNNLRVRSDQPAM
jgi:hypothetical protein